MIELNKNESVINSIKHHPDDRPLSIPEQGFELLSRSSRSWVAMFISCIRGPLTEKIVRRALDMIQSRHPRLNVRIVGPDDNLRFESEGTAQIPLRVVNNEQWQDIVLEELNQNIDSHQVLMRAVLVYSENGRCYLITTIHHAIVDGLSGIRLQQEILTNCQNITSGEQMPQVERVSALPPFEALLPETLHGFKDRGKMLFDSVLFLLKTLWFRPKSLGFEKCVPVALRRTGLVQKQLDEALTQQLLKTCKKKNITVQAALCAAMLFAITRKMSVGKKSKLCASCGTSIDLRRRLTPPISDEHLGAMVSTLMSYHTLRTNTSFWELARDVKQKVEAELKTDKIFTSNLVFRKNIAFFLAHPNITRWTTVVTNVGKINLPKVYGPYELESISFMPSMAAFGGIFAMAVTTFGGKMVMNFPFSEPSINQETMAVLTSNVMFCITEACQRENFYFKDLP